MRNAFPIATLRATIARPLDTRNLVTCSFTQVHVSRCSSGHLSRALTDACRELSLTLCLNDERSLTATFGTSRHTSRRAPKVFGLNVPGSPNATTPARGRSSSRFDVGLAPASALPQRARRPHRSALTRKSQNKNSAVLKIEMRGWPWSMRAAWTRHLRQSRSNVVARCWATRKTVCPM
jgi:hypothetical protein